MPWNPPTDPRPLPPVPPDPEQMNDERAEWARAALDTFIKQTKADPEDAISDLLVDLRHLCDRDATLSAWDRNLDRAALHYDDETAETDDPEPDEDDEDEDDDCPECARSYGPHYRGRCDH